MIENKQPIPARLYNAAKGGHVAGAIDIIDDILNKTQDTINQETVGSGNGSLKEQVAAIEVITHIGDIDVQLTTSPDDIVTTGEGASKLPLSVAIAGKLFLYYTKNEIDSIVEIINGNINSKASSEALAAEMQLRRDGDATLLGTNEDTAEVNSIKGLRAAITSLSGNEGDSADTDSIIGLRAAILALLGTNDDSDETDTIRGLRAAINLIKQEIEDLPHGGGGGGDTPITIGYTARLKGYYVYLYSNNTWSEIVSPTLLLLKTAANTKVAYTETAGNIDLSSVANPQEGDLVFVTRDSNS